MSARKRVIKAAVRVAQSPETHFPRRQAHETLVQEGFGRLIGREYVIEAGERIALKEWLGGHGVDWRAAPVTGHREQDAARGPNEKFAPLPTGHGRVLLSPLSSGVSLNGVEFHPLPALDGFASFDGAKIEAIGAQALMVVENSRAFYRLREFGFEFDTSGVLAVYRGDPQHPYGGRLAGEWARAWRLPVWSFGDFDPAGLCIADDLGAQQLVVPNLEVLADIRGSFADFNNQGDQWARAQRLYGEGRALAPWIEFLARRKAGFTQERIFSHDIPLQIVTAESHREPS